MTPEQIELAQRAMKPQPETLLQSLRDGMCVEDQRCEVRTAASGCDCAIIADYIDQLHNATGWQPIQTLQRLDVNIVLWHPRDGVHVLDVMTSAHEMNEIRRGQIFTHWRKLDPPQPYRTTS